MRKMKDSGIEWIGEIPEGWEIVPVRSCFDEVRTKNTNGQEQNALQFKSGNIISKANFNANTDDYVADTITNYTVVLPDTVMINGLNLNYDFKSLRVALVKEKGVITSAYLAIFPDRKKISPQYATYLFKGYETKMAFHNMGAGIRKTLGYKEFKNQPLLLPSKEEQNKISAYLDSKCSHIDTMLFRTRSGIEEYKKLKQAVITQAITKGVRGEREMKDSGVEWIGEIPREWDVTKIGRIGQTSSGATPLRSKETSFFDDATIRWVRTLDLNDGLVYDSSEKITELALSMSACSIMPTGTVCVAMYGGAGTIGKCGLLMTPCATNQAVCSIICNSNVILPKFLLNQLLALKPYWMKYAVGTRKDPNISQDTVARMKVLIPPLSEQKEIVDYLDAKCAEIDGLIAKKEQLVKELESYKKSLIYEVVTGKREV